MAVKKITRSPCAVRFGVGECRDEARKQVRKLRQEKVRSVSLWRAIVFNFKETNTHARFVCRPPQASTKFSVSETRVTHRGRHTECACYRPPKHRT